jgi:hypothetical protein
MSCMRRCIMIAWVEIPSTPFIGKRGMIYMEDPVG